MKMSHSEFEQERVKELEHFNQLNEKEKAKYQQKLTHIPPKIPRPRQGKKYQYFFSSFGIDFMKKHTNIF